MSKILVYPVNRGQLDKFKRIQKNVRLLKHLEINNQKLWPSAFKYCRGEKQTKRSRTAGKERVQEALALRKHSACRSFPSGRLLTLLRSLETQPHVHKRSAHVPPHIMLHLNTPQEQKQVFSAEVSTSSFPDWNYWHISKTLLHAGERSQLSSTRVDRPSNSFASSCVLSLTTEQWL